MPVRATQEEIIAHLRRPLARPLIAIDGLPCSGKTTLAARLVDIFNFDGLGVDEFLLPEEHWPEPCRPGFPFPYIRYDEFLNAVLSLAETGRCTYHPFDWEIMDISPRPREVSLAEGPVIIEGISAMVPLLDRVYGLKIFVESDRKTVLDVAKNRALGLWAREWKEIFIPSADMYMQTRPEKRADFVLAGRGVGPVPDYLKPALGVA